MSLLSVSVFNNNHSTFESAGFSVEAVDDWRWAEKKSRTTTNHTNCHKQLQFQIMFCIRVHGGTYRSVLESKPNQEKIVWFIAVVDDQIEGITINKMEFWGKFTGGRGAGVCGDNDGGGGGGFGLE